MIQFFKVCCLSAGPMRPRSRWIYLGWSGEAPSAKMRGTLGTVGTLIKFFEKYAGFSECHQNANGTLYGGQSEKGSTGR